MKNIHVIATDNKPSRLVKQKYDTIDRLCLADMATKRAEYKRFNLYITSDEEIKEGDWYINTFVSEREQKPQTHTEKRHLINHQKDYRFKYCKKIILTTDQDLIKDGIQAIDDDFLEWFVKNSSCEKVDIKIKSTLDKVDGHYHDLWEIIIPKEERNPFELQKTLPNDVFYESLEPKQETLEEAAERLFPDSNIQKRIFIKGAKWQQKTSYSEEEVINLLQDFANEDFANVIDIKEWFDLKRDA